MGHRRHVPQERLQRLPREPGIHRLCRARFGRTGLGHATGPPDADDRICERERHQHTFGCRVTRRDDPAPRISSIMRHWQYISLYPLVGPNDHERPDYGPSLWTWGHAVTWWIYCINRTLYRSYHFTLYFFFVVVFAVCAGGLQVT